jgi:hypothetical protein
MPSLFERLIEKLGLDNETYMVDVNEPLPFSDIVEDVDSYPIEDPVRSSVLTAAKVLVEAGVPLGAIPCYYVEEKGRFKELELRGIYFPLAYAVATALSNAGLGKAISWTDESATVGLPYFVTTFKKV